MTWQFIFIIFLLSALIGISILYAIGQSRAKQHLHNISQRIFSLLSISQDAIILLDEKNTIYYHNDAMRELLQISEKQRYLIDSDMPNIYYRNELKRFRDFIQDAYRQLQKDDELAHFPHIIIETRKQGKVAVDLYLGKTYNPDRQTEQYIIVIRDLREALREIASGERDPLTRLPNRAKAYQDYQMLCSRYHLQENRVALMTISLDDFLVTQSLVGHHEADKIIRAVSHLLTQLAMLHAYKTYYLTYANFLLVFPKSESTDELFRIARIIQNRISLLFEEHKSSVYLTASIGIAATPESGKITELFNKAHEALIDARKHGIGNTSLAPKSSLKQRYDESVLQHDIQYAIKQNELHAYYQPIIDARSRTIIAAEALMRWHHPKYGMIPPLYFIPLMEKSGFMVEAGRFLIREVIHQQAKWKVFGFEEIVVSLNASMREIEHPDYIPYLTGQLREHDVRPETIKVEITESLTMNNTGKILEAFKQLRRAGIGLSLDDFGTGYTSFSYLTQIPATTLKIDKAFIDSILTDRKSRQVVRAIIEVGHALEMDIVAEGIEDAKTAKLLTDLACDYLQGYHFSKPVPAFELQAYLRRKEKTLGEKHELKRNTSSETDILPLDDL